MPDTGPYAAGELCDWWVDGGIEGGGVKKLFGVLSPEAQKDFLRDTVILATFISLSPKEYHY